MAEAYFYRVTTSGETELSKEQVLLEAGIAQEGETALAPSTCWGIGPIQLCFVVPSAAEVDLEIQIFGLKVASAKLNAANPALSASANILAVKANVTVTADFKAKHLAAAGSVCYRKVKVFPPKIWWECHGFNQVIFHW